MSRDTQQNVEFLAQSMERLMDALAARCLADANAQREQPRDWPAGQTWDEIGTSSKAIFRQQARREAGLDGTPEWRKRADDIYAAHDIDYDVLRLRPVETPPRGQLPNEVAIITADKPVQYRVLEGNDIRVTGRGLSDADIRPFPCPDAEEREMTWHANRDVVEHDHPYDNCTYLGNNMWDCGVIDG